MENSRQRDYQVLNPIFIIMEIRYLENECMHVNLDFFFPFGEFALFELRRANID